MTHVYVIACGDHVKIGISNNPEVRLRSMSTGMPEKPYIVATRHFQTRILARQMEGLMHWHFRANRSRGEWFRVTADDAKRALRYMKFPAGSAALASKRIAEMFDRQEASPEFFGHGQ